MEKPLLPRTVLPTDGMLGRCPYCHDTIERDARWLVCEQCLARHHTECWTESGECACCRFGHVIGGPRRSARRLVIGVVALALVNVGLGAGLWWWTAPVPPPTKEQVEEAERLEALLRAVPGAYAPSDFRANRPFARDFPDVIPKPLLRSKEPIVLTFDSKELERQRRRLNELDELLDDDLRAVDPRWVK